MESPKPSPRGQSSGETAPTTTHIAESNKDPTEKCMSPGKLPTPRQPEQSNV